MNQSSKRSLFGTQPRLLSYLAGAIAPALVAMAAPALADGPFVVSTAISLPAGQTLTAVDISFVDPVVGVYLLADRTNKSIDVISTVTNTVIKQLRANYAGIVLNAAGAANNDLSGPDGVMLVNHTTVWSGDGDSSFKVLDLNSGALLARIHTGGTTRVDEMCYDPVHNIVAGANNAEDPPFITMVNGSAPYNILGKIAFDGTNGTPNATNGIEQCQWAPQIGRFIVAVPEVNGPGNNSAQGGVSVINPVTNTVERTYIVPPPCRGPQGTAIGPNNQLALNCNATTQSVIIDVTNGNVIAPLAVGSGGGDMVWYNPGNARYYFANSAQHSPALPLQILGIVDATGANNFSFVTTSNKTAPTNHSVAADPVKNQAYVPILATSTAGVCSAGGGSDAAGCIAVITSPDDTMCTVGGAPVISVGGTSPNFLQTLCLLHAVP